MPLVTTVCFLPLNGLTMEMPASLKLHVSLSTEEHKKREGGGGHSKTSLGKGCKRKVMEIHQ